MLIDPITALSFSLFENRGVYTLLLGSGLSRAAQIPTGWEITLDLVRRVAASNNVSGQPDWAAWYRTQFGKEPNYSDVLDALSSSPDERRASLHSYIEPSDDDLREGRRVPTRAHHAIAWLVKQEFVRAILTTNFDRLMENALREAGIEPSVIRSEDDLNGAIPLIHSRCTVVKLHGDYLDTRIKNTNEELTTYSPAMDGLLDRILDEHGLIICGWSGEWDNALRAAIARTPNRRYPTFWASRGQIGPLASDLITQRAAKVIPITEADGFFADLQEKIATQVEAQRPNPRSTELIVGTVKRYLARPEHRIQLYDLLADESRRLMQELGDPTAFAMEGGATADDYRARVRRYEAATEVLMRIFGIVGRWGNQPAHEIAGEIVDSVSFLRIQGGLNWWLDLRFYPAVLLFYGLGLGILKAEKYEELFKLFARPVQRDQCESQSFVQRLAYWHSETHDRWKMLEGFEKHMTPLSDHLHEMMGAVMADIVPDDRGRTRLFKRFEILAALAYLTIHADKQNFQQAHADATQRNFVWAPVGRAGWDRSTRDSILAHIEQPDTKRALLQAGFGRGDEQHFNLALESIRRLMSRLQWF